MEWISVKEKIIERLNERYSDINEKLHVVDGFVNLRLEKAVGDLTIAGPIIPVIVAVGNETGRVYFYSFNDLGINNKSDKCSKCLKDVGIFKYCPYCGYNNELD